ncbi:sugar ABC transporter ATP-binding protein [Lacihabitans sp. CCS-44]|uniref:sugar ABC transporter ATP-binding protein n=1 Tax=Lacihabitans sp. CCS-44 TaxID=2487331 RepID=UPI0020CEAE44|nr:sugar ABC transporter ATP-binding protein [Lacihabitans sp. CCS-44]MCP9757356.1 sugar ABC transporter ATP-binding protein [Lacihabitans sp. CCS-44]
MLEAINISKSFPGVKALDGVSMRFQPGKVTAILGENGAGKSTLLKILSGVYIDFDGEILICGEAKKFSKITDSQEAGIAIIHQELNLIADLNITENLFLGNEITNDWGVLESKKMEKLATEQMSKVGLDYSPKTKIKNLKIGEQQLVEIAKSLLFDANIIFMDEPTSALSDKEIDKLHLIINTLRNEGKIIVYISHKMDELFKIADRYEVLRDGVSIGSGELKDISEQELIKMMVGREVLKKTKAVKRIDQNVLLSVRNLSLLDSGRNKNRLQNINLNLKKGEILGVFGLMGAGRTELLESLFGLNSDKISGEIQIDGTSLNLKSPKNAIEKGIAFLTEDRKSEGLVLEMDIGKNISLTTLAEFDLLRPKNENAEAELYVKSLNIKTPTIHTLCQNLSGGNQQKVVLAKWLSTEPKILLMDEPTRGIDINAKNEIYKLIEKLASEGLSIIVASSEIPELLAISDRILVMADGKISGEFSAEEATEEKLLKAAIG